MVDYYEAPSDSIFDEIKEKSIEIRNTYDNTYGYVDEKVERIKDLQNISDNACYMVAMFDIHNQRKLLNKLSSEGQVFLLPRLYPND